MGKTCCVGIVSYGNAKFTELAIKSIRDTVLNHSVDFVVVNAKPGDLEVSGLCEKLGISCISHDANWGFPKSVNDIYDYAWKEGKYDYLILAGNDIVAYPTTIDEMIDLADNSPYAVISALQYDVRSLVSEHPEMLKFFKTDKMLFDDFTQKPWEAFKDWNKTVEIADMQLFDIQNLCLYKREYFDAVGYVDVNFWPGGYFGDNDLARRIVNSGIKTCSLCSSRFFHFWSRTIYQGNGTSSRQFEKNKSYYMKKWGGDVGKETIVPETKISTREDELLDIMYWMNNNG